MWHIIKGYNGNIPVLDNKSNNVDIPEIDKCIYVVNENKQIIRTKFQLYNSYIAYIDGTIIHDDMYWCYEEEMLPKALLS